MNSDVPNWWPTHGIIYDIDKSWSDNLRDGPFMNGMPVPPRKFLPKEKWSSLFGFPIASPLGVPAGPLLGSKWIDLAARLGFDVVSYKTIRSSEFNGHPVPNMIYVDPNEVLESLNTKDELNHPIHQLSETPLRMKDLAITNSFGMPSRNKQFLQEDIKLANEALQEGQVMIVSVVGTPSHTGDKSVDYTNFVKDFADVAAFAKSCGAKIIEANFSCPNVVTGEGSIYQSAESVRDIASAIRGSIGDTPFVIKVGTYKNKELMESVLKTADQVNVSGICGINSVSMKVFDKNGQSALGANRLVSGICGAPIKSHAVNFVKDANSIIKQHNLRLSLLGCGGITEPADFQEFLDAGAVVAMSATGMMWDPYLALRYHNLPK